MQIRNYTVTILGWILFACWGTSYAWTVDDNYDSQSVGQRCGSFWQDSANSKVTDQMSSSGGKSCKFSVTKGNTAIGGGFVFPSDLKKNDEVWIRFRLFLPQGYDYNAYSAGNKLKFIRVATRTTANVGAFWDWEWMPEGSNPPYGVSLARDNCTTNCWQKFGAPSDKPNRGTWETYEVYIKFDNVQVASGGSGRVRTWKNGKLIGDLTARRTINNATDVAKSALFFSYWNGGAPQTQDMYFDDLVATNVRPTSRDSFGNPYIGVGNFVATSPPMYPSGIH